MISTTDNYYSITGAAEDAEHTPNPWLLLDIYVLHETCPFRVGLTAFWLSKDACLDLLFECFDQPVRRALSASNDFNIIESWEMGNAKGDNWNIHSLIDLSLLGTRGY